MRLKYWQWSRLKTYTMHVNCMALPVLAHKAIKFIATYLYYWHIPGKISTRRIIKHRMWQLLIELKSLIFWPLIIPVKLRNIWTSHFSENSRFSSFYLVLLAGSWNVYLETDQYVFFSINYTFLLSN